MEAALFSKTLESTCMSTELYNAEANTDPLLLLTTERQHATRHSPCCTRCSQGSQHAMGMTVLLYEVQSGLPTWHGDNAVPPVRGAVRAPNMPWGRHSACCMRCSQGSQHDMGITQSQLHKVQSGLPTWHGDNAVPAVRGAVRAPNMTWGRHSPSCTRCSQGSQHDMGTIQSQLYEVQSGLPTWHRDKAVQVVWGAVRAPNMPWGWHSPKLYEVQSGLPIWHGDNAVQVVWGAVRAPNMSVTARMRLASSNGCSTTDVSL
jgi:hypothetical protein